MRTNIFQELWQCAVQVYEASTHNAGVEVLKYLFTGLENTYSACKLEHLEQFLDAEDQVFIPLLLREGEDQLLRHFKQIGHGLADGNPDVCLEAIQAIVMKDLFAFEAAWVDAMTRLEDLPGPAKSYRPALLALQAGNSRLERYDRYPGLAQAEVIRGAALKTYLNQLGRYLIDGYSLWNWTFLPFGVPEGQAQVEAGFGLTLVPEKPVAGKKIQAVVLTFRGLGMEMEVRRQVEFSTRFSVETHFYVSWKNLFQDWRSWEWDLKPDEEEEEIKSELEKRPGWEPGAEQEFLSERNSDLASKVSTVRDDRFWRVTVGAKGEKWAVFLEKGIAAIDYDDKEVGRVDQYPTLEALNLAAGEAENSNSNRTGALWNFFQLETGTILFANQGGKICQGIGIVTGPYRYVASDSGFRHQREVNWFIEKQLEFDSNIIPSHTNVFRFDTFSRIHTWQYVLKHYAETFPEVIPLFKKFGLDNTYGSLELPCSSLAMDPGEGSYSTFEAPGAATRSGNSEFLNLQTGDADAAKGSPDSTLQADQPNFWWFNFNPKQWHLADNPTGAEDYYTAINEKGNKRRVYKYFQAVRPGELGFGYSTGKDRAVQALVEITSVMQDFPGVGEAFRFKLLEKFKHPVPWKTIEQMPGMQHCEVLKNNQGSLFRLSQEEFESLRDYVDELNLESESPKQTVPDYGVEDAMQELFLDKAAFLRKLEQLKRKKNIVLEGPPGVGKTFLAKRLAYTLMNKKDEDRLGMVQFHQNYAYEDFIQGLRPNAAGQFILKDGIFKRFCDRARMATPDSPFVFIIDEINRGNLSKIFGELMMLLEADKRNAGYAVPLTYDPEERFYIPDNVYVIGTMNTADRSLALVDYALRRRFAFLEMAPCFNDRFRQTLKARKLDEELITRICNRISALNEELCDDPDLGEGFRIGHSYFCPSEEETEVRTDWYRAVIEFEIGPLLKEYWFDKPDKVQAKVNQLLEL